MRQLRLLCPPCRHIALSPRGVLRPFSPPPLSLRNGVIGGIANIDSYISKNLSLTHRHAQSTLSAIHSGLRSASRMRRPGAENWRPPKYTLLKGKKVITDKGPQPKSRAYRFNDATESFGKKSHVYQLRNGDLRDRLDTLEDKYSERQWETKSRRRENIGTSRTARSRNIEDSRSGRSSRYEATDRSSGLRPSVVRGVRDKHGNWVTPKASRADKALLSKAARVLNKRGPEPPEPVYVRGAKKWDGPPHAHEGARQRREHSREHSNKSTETNSRANPRQSQRGDQRDRPRDRDDEQIQSREDAPNETYHQREDKYTSPVRIRHTTAASQFLFGFNVVKSALSNSRRQFYHLYLYDGPSRTDSSESQNTHLSRLAFKLQMSVTRLKRPEDLKMLDKMSEGRPHNGVVLEASAIPQLPLEGLGAVSGELSNPEISIFLKHQSAEDAAINGTAKSVSYTPRGRQKPFFLLLDGILDPGNLGAILRTAAFLGITGVAITNYGSATLTPITLKASAGASEVLPIYSVSSAVNFLDQSKRAGWVSYAAVPMGTGSGAGAGGRSSRRNNTRLTLEYVSAYDPLSEAPVILVIGGEAEGLAWPVRRAADFDVSIPPGGPLAGPFGVVDSLNVSVATAVLCQAFLGPPPVSELDVTLLSETREKDKEEVKEEDDKLW